MQQGRISELHECDIISCICLCSVIAQFAIKVREETTDREIPGMQIGNRVRTRLNLSIHERVSGTGLTTARTAPFHSMCN
jgi:hypothetical protein